MIEPQNTPEAKIGRRGRPRLRLGVPARLTTYEGAQSVILDDLSLTGAQVRLTQGEKFSSGVLEWLQFDVLVDLVWQDKDTCGVKFDKPLSKECILVTREAAPGLLDEENQLRSFAKCWSEGSVN